MQGSRKKLKCSNLSEQDMFERFSCGTITASGGHRSDTWLSGDAAEVTILVAIVHDMEGLIKQHQTSVKEICPMTTTPPSRQEFSLPDSVWLVFIPANSIFFMVPLCIFPEIAGSPWDLHVRLSYTRYVEDFNPEFIHTAAMWNKLPCSSSEFFQSPETSNRSWHRSGHRSWEKNVFFLFFPCGS